MDVFHIVVTAVAASLMIIGLIGCVVPRLPGLGMTWLGLFVYAIVTRFSAVHLDLIAIAGGLVLLSWLLDYREVHGHMKKFHVTFVAIFAAMTGAFLGSVYGIFPGLTLGAMLGSIIGELATGHDVPYYMETQQAKYVGYLGGTILRTTFALIIIAIWIRRVFF